MKKAFIFVLLFSCFLSKVNAQALHQNMGWLFLLNSTRFNTKWGMHLDVQLRSSADWNQVRNTLVRPGITYFINQNNNVTLGYLLATTYPTGLSNTSFNEHRIWEQYILTHQIKSIFASQRFRLEQRFVEQANGNELFAQRFRYFFRLIKPLQKPEKSFSKGMFLALQNELFFNVQNKDLLNRSIFDQNRAYLAAGYRFSKQVDLEAGYLNQAIHGAASNTINHVVQLALYTRF